MTKRRTVLVSATGVAAGAALAACSSASASARWNTPGSSGASGASGPASVGASPADAAITVTPVANAASVSPANGVTVTATTGTLQSVTVGGNGSSVAGSMSADQKTWQSTGRLAYGATYTVTATLSGGGTKTCSFSTVKPAKLVSATLQANAMALLNDGGTYGVGQPLIVAFNRPPADQDAAVNALDVKIDPPVEVKWHWVENDTVHGRPEKFWAAGTKITINANIFGANLGKGMYGKANNSASITIGPSHIAIADSNTHYMKVYVDGQLVKNMPCSMGKGGTTHGSKGELIDFWTSSGYHVVLEKDASVTMSSASYGITNKNDPNYYSETVTLCCRISYSGEYTHSAPWSVSAQGHSNVSHGCINLSPANAQWIFNNFRVGDVVQVLNTPKPLPLWNGLGCWNVPWSQW